MITRGVKKSKLTTANTIYSLMLFLLSQIKRIYTVHVHAERLQEVACDARFGLGLTIGGGFEFAFLEGIKNITVI